MTARHDNDFLWFELSVEADHEAVEPVAELFASIGYNNGVVIEESFTQDRDGDNVAVDTNRPAVVRTYVSNESFVESEWKRIEQGLWHLGQIRAVGPLLVARRHEEDWANSWKKHYVPVRASDRLVIRPPWHDYKGKKRDVVVVLDPGMAFGTGTHPSSQICLRLMERLSLANASLLDVGTGSGILAIAAARLGAARIDAVDIDPVAVRQANENVVLNDVSSLVKVWQSSMTCADAPIGHYDLVVANIISRVLIELSEVVVSKILPGGQLVLSGIINSKEASVAECYQRQGLELVDRLQIEDWVGLVWTRGGGG